MNSPLVLSIFVILLAASQCARAGDWMTWRSTYTHDPATGHRVEQYAIPVEPLAPDQGNLVRSGYRHYRSTIQAGQSADNLHTVVEWGRPVMPYEHWRFPYRPYGAPYDAWGPPTPGVLSNFNYAAYPPHQHPHGPPGVPGPGSGGPGSGPPASGGYQGGYQGGNYNSGYGAGYGGGYGGGYPGGYPGGGSAYPLVPPYQPAPWNDGLYPAAPPLDNQTDRQFFYRPPASLGP